MRQVAIAVIGVLAAGCGSDGSTGGNGAITIEGGANQTAEVGSALQPYSVKVSNAPDGMRGDW